MSNTIIQVSRNFHLLKLWGFSFIQRREVTSTSPSTKSVPFGFLINGSPSHYQIRLSTSMSNTIIQVSRNFHLLKLWGFSFIQRREVTSTSPSTKTVPFGFLIRRCRGHSPSHYQIRLSTSMSNTIIQVSRNFHLLKLWGFSFIQRREVTSTSSSTKSVPFGFLINGRAFSPSHVLSNSAVNIHE